MAKALADQRAGVSAHMVCQLKELVISIISSSLRSVSFVTSTRVCSLSLPAAEQQLSKADQSVYLAQQVLPG